MSFSEAVAINPKRVLPKGGLVPFLNMASLPLNGADVSVVAAREVGSGGSKFQSGDTLFARITPCAENGKLGFVRSINDGEVAQGSTEFIVMGGRDGLTLPEYIRYLAGWSEVRDQAVGLMEGTSGRQRVPNWAFDEIEIPVPPLDEQGRIAEVLRSVDEVIAYEVKVREAAEASLEHAIAALMPFPEAADSDWTATTIGEFATVITGKTPSTKDEGLWGGEIPFVTPTDMDGSVRSVRAARTVTKAAIKHTKIAPANSVLFTCIASIGKLCLNHEPVAFNQQINACACRDGTDAAFLYWTLRRLAPQIRAMSGTTAVPIVNKSDFSRVSFAAPPSATRREIVEVLSSISEVVEAARHTISSLTALKSLISSDLLSGRVTVPA